MNEQAKTELPCGEHGAGVSWHPLRKWWRSSQLFNRDVGLLPLLEPWELRWMSVDGLQRSLAARSWPACIAAPLFVASISGLTPPRNQRSEEQHRWRVILDVAHFSPSEISLRVTDGFLEVGGKHEERQDEHGYAARCFTTKYRLPGEIDAAKIMSRLSADGILTVEAPVLENELPAPVIIPIKVEMGRTGEKHEKEEVPDTEPESCGGVEAPDILSLEDDGEESSFEFQSDQAQADGVTAGLQRHEGRAEEEEAHEEPAGESHLSVLADGDGEGSESRRDSSKHQVTLESQESSDADRITLLEHKQPGVEGEAAEDITQPDELELDASPQIDQRQALEDPDMKQEHAE